MTTLSCDVETYSPVDLSAAGAYKYTEADAFEVLLFGYSVDYGAVQVVECAEGERLPADVRDMLRDPGVLKTAYNAPFERAAIGRMVGEVMPPEQWACTMVLAAQAGLPLGLEAVCLALGLPEDKAKQDGKSLIRFFCSPCKPTLANGGRTRNMPWDDYEKWERFVGYNRRDVEVENLIRKKLLRLQPTDDEQRFWELDQRINDKGVRLDLELARQAIAMNKRYTADLADEAIRLTGIQNVKSQAQIKDWLYEQEGLAVESLNKKAMPDVLAQLKTDKAKQFLDLRAELSKTSTAKYEKMLTCACKDDHARGLFQFYGANRTGRMAGRLLQLQNLPQNHLPNIADIRALVRAGAYDELEATNPKIASVLSELIRTAIIPEPGCHFLVADFSAIEARVLAWFAGESADLEEFRGAGKIYELTASRMFGVDKEKIVKGNPEYELRAKGKVACLSCGYGGGPKALVAMGALRSGIAEDQLPHLVELWRSSHRNVVRLWRSLEDTAKEAIRLKARAKDYVGGVVFSYEGRNLFMELPSGRRLAYVNACIGENRFGNPSILYAGTNQVTHKWEMLETYGGKLTENCIAGGTLVITDRGPVAIESVRLSDRVWDGEAFVSHAGVVAKGTQKTISANGIWMTEEHLILTEGGWVHCGEAEGLNWAEVRHPNGYPACRERIRTRVAGRISVCRAEREERVYDIRDCGPRHRFAVVTPDGGLRLVHNCVQATARDLLRDAMMRLDKAGFDIRMHVHDEIIVNEPVGGRTVDEVCEIMSITPGWAHGLPMKAAGFETDFYMKD